MKSELHNQVNNFLTKNTTLLLYPKLDSKKLVQTQSRVLTTKVARLLMNLGHGAALYKLRFKCEERGVHLIVPSEAYTTKTCICGAQNDIGSSKLYTCSHCGYKMDRDLHGAQNVMLRTVFMQVGQVGAQCCEG